MTTEPVNTEPVNTAPAPTDAVTTNRRTILKAVAAAGIVWTAPVLQPITAHAAGTCTSFQFGGDGEPEDTTDPAEDPDSCTPCEPGGQIFSSTCNCGAGFTYGVATPIAAGPGVGQSGVFTWDGFDPDTYTAPEGCTIVDATARMFETDPPSGAPCEVLYPCYTIGSGISISPDNKVLTFDDPGTKIYDFIRVLLCCG